MLNVIIDYFMQIINPLEKDINVLRKDTINQDMNTSNNQTICKNYWIYELKLCFCSILYNFKLSHTSFCRGGTVYNHEISQGEYIMYYIGQAVGEVLHFHLRY